MSREKMIQDAHREQVQKFRSYTVLTLKELKHVIKEAKLDEWDRTDVTERYWDKCKGYLDCMHEMKIITIDEWVRLAKTLTKLFLKYY